MGKCKDPDDIKRDITFIVYSVIVISFLLGLGRADGIEAEAETPSVLIE
ncbi:hypothetical protein ACFQ88_10615 [Paenibacillus sp. NPDC056579]|nr:hypothetical protein [Paenibacillus sp. H1-7]